MKIINAEITPATLSEHHTDSVLTHEINFLRLQTIPRFLQLDTIQYSQVIRGHRRGHRRSETLIHRHVYYCALVYDILYIHWSSKGANVTVTVLQYCAARLFSTLVIIRNVSWAVYYDDFWRSCDWRLEEWCWKYSCASQKYISLMDIWNCNNISRFYYIDNQINAVFLNRRDS